MTAGDKILIIPRLMRSQYVGDVILLHGRALDQRVLFSRGSDHNCKFNFDEIIIPIGYDLAIKRRKDDICDHLLPRIYPIGNKKGGSMKEAKIAEVLGIREELVKVIKKAREERSCGCCYVYSCAEIVNEVMATIIVLNKKGLNKKGVS